MHGNEPGVPPEWSQPALGGAHRACCFLWIRQLGSSWCTASWRERMESRKRHIFKNSTSEALRSGFSYSGGPSSTREMSVFTGTLGWQAA